MIHNTELFNPTLMTGIRPYAHQEREYLESRNSEYRGLFWEMGCGKSKPLVDTMAWLFLTCEIDGVLIISDKGCYDGWVRDHLPKFLPPEIPSRIVLWSSSMRRGDQERVHSALTAMDDMLDIFVMNVEAFSGSRGVEVARQFLTNHHAMMIVDESTSIKSHRAQRTKEIIKLGRLAEYRRIATGTPVTQGPLDLWSQCEFLSPGISGFKTYTAFRCFYAVLVTMNMGMRTFQQVTSYRNLDVLKKSIAPFTSRLLKEECVDLPDKIYETVYVEQTPEQKKYYDKLKDEAVFEIDTGVITSTNALTTIGKLHQINCGHVMDDSGTCFDIPSNRISVLLEQVEKIPGKIVVWCYYQRDVQLVYDALGAYHPVRYFGETSQKDRVIALSTFRDDPDCRVFVGTPASGGKGINDLVVASTMIYYSNHYNLEDRLQSEDRLHRPGQVNRVTIIDLVIPGTVDVKIVKALKTKQDLAKEILDRARLRSLLVEDDLQY